MPYVNEHYLKLAAGYLFPEIARRVAAFSDANPKQRIIRMGIGDVTEPLPPAVISAMHRAVDDQASRESFHGYGPSEGYPWLREKIAKFLDITRADELIVSMPVFDMEARLKSVRLFAEAQRTLEQAA